MRQTLLTVAICTMNGAKRLPAVLTALESQEGVTTDDWELLVVDNRSTDETRDVTETFLKRTSGKVRGFCVREDTLGAAAARRRAIREANAEWLVFLDDDNIPSPRFLAETAAFICRHPKAGAAGGPSHIVVGDHAVPEWFRHVEEGFAIWSGGSEERLLEKMERRFTAGLAVQVAAARSVLEEKWVLEGRHRGSLVAGEDLELCTKLERKGFELWYCPAMQFEHRLAADRLSMEYARRLFQSFGETHVVFSPFYFPLCGSGSLRFLQIALTAPLKLASGCLRLPFQSEAERWKTRKSIWSYQGVCRAAIRQLRKRLRRGSRAQHAG